MCLSHDRERRGWTLVELLVATSLMALVGGATVSALAGGVRVWERAAALGTHDESVLMAFSRMRRDLHNLRWFAPLPFDGTYEAFAFATVGHADTDPSQVEALGRLSYFLGGRERALCRAFTPYPLARRQRITDRCHPVLEGVTRLRFRYFGIGQESGVAAWRERWDSPEPPLALKVELTLQEGRRQSTHTTVVYLPSSATDGESKKDEDASQS